MDVSGLRGRQEMVQRLREVMQSSQSQAPPQPPPRHPPPVVVTMRGGGHHSSAQQTAGPAVHIGGHDHNEEWVEPLRADPCVAGAALVSSVAWWGICAVLAGLGGVRRRRRRTAQPPHSLPGAPPPSTIWVDGCGGVWNVRSAFAGGRSVGSRGRARASTSRGGPCLRAWAPIRCCPSLDGEDEWAAALACRQTTLSLPVA